MTNKLLGNLKKGIIFVISSPSGAGKSTLVEMLLKEFPADLARSITCTTREPRITEQKGKDYFFLSRDEFLAKQRESEFLEFAEVFGNYYGTLKKNVDEILQQGKHVLLVIDTQGAKQMAQLRDDARFIFISPPSMEELQRRLHSRETETKTTMERRLQRARIELSEKIHYDYQIINDDLKTAYQVLRSIIIAEEHKIY